MDKVLGAFIWLKANLKQSGTMASLAVICQYANVNLDVALVNHILDVATLGFGVLGFFFQEAKPLAKV